MTEEIKEVNLSEMLFNRDERLLDYITNLQKENEKLKETLQTDRLMKAFMVEHNRNEKAVELLQLLHYKFADGDSIHHDIEDIQKELQGGDE